MWKVDKKSGIGEELEMNINNFETYINKTIVDRGYSYYIEGNVVEAFGQGENEYIFHIEGSDEYEVLVEIGDNGDILNSDCDCPYDFGPVCKHEVAAYFQLNEMLNQVMTNDNKMNKSSKRTTIQEILNKLSKEELITIITNIANNDTTLENSIIVKYSTDDNQHEFETCQELIDSIVRKYTGREGFIKYRDTGAFVRELDDVVEKARKLIDNNFVTPSQPDWFVGIVVPRREILFRILLTKSFLYSFVSFEVKC
jgi:uncharacterized Zn finger protein